MKALLLYLGLGLVSSLAHHGAQHLERIAFWRDVLAWPFVAVGKIVDLRVLLSDTAQNYLMVVVAAVLIVNAVMRVDLPSARPSRPVRPERRQSGL